MRRSHLVSPLWIASLVVSAGILLGLSAAAAETKAEAPPAKAEAAPAAPAAPAPAPAAAVEKADAKKFTRRLPNYYAQIVDETQKEKIYGIQSDYFAKIEALRGQLEALEKERDAKVAAVLTPEQQKQLADFKAAAKTSRDAKKPPKGKKTATPPAAPAK